MEVDVLEAGSEGMVWEGDGESEGLDFSVVQGELAAQGVATGPPYSSVTWSPTLSSAQNEQLLFFCSVCPVALEKVTDCNSYLTRRGTKFFLLTRKKKSLCISFINMNTKYMSQGSLPLILSLIV